MCSLIRGLRYARLIWNDLSPYLADTVGNLVTILCLKLVFRNELPDTIYTFSKIKDGHNNPLKVVLWDTESGSIVSDEDDPLSSIKVEICVLDGDFNSDDSENWSKEFNSKILRQRDNRGQLLKGDTVIALENGEGFLNELSFTDNSSWIRTRRFRLGVVVKSNLNNAVNIREGISKPFTVKNYRSDLNKRQNPSPNDEVWHLKHISKKGKAFEQLSKNGIHTVEDLLNEHETNPSSLQEKLGNICKRKREEIIKQAKKAKYDKTGVAEMISDGQNYQSENNSHNSDQRIELIKHDFEKTWTQATNNGAPDQDNCLIADEEGMPLLFWSSGFGSTSTPSDISPLFFPGDDEAAPTNHHSSLPNKGKNKMV
ncbi:hypothetical protein PHAVU_001G226200 [Phaseolus vulgaris]|uniref:Calmodulin-binding protein n=1 Tax=Phaseolus vulgaris TaxID=3885 RepID=V7CYZ8_PHAVU|nr:hypothetical protein PHAVU_001G226200g [Phaseolus vulgaris]ESW35329.1 hypothetical protein PHAVU_001G226200g [Phaseolus vulgaris]